MVKLVVNIVNCKNKERASLVKRAADVILHLQILAATI